MPKRKVLPLESGRLRLRLIEESDLPLTLAWRNQDHIRKWFIFSAALTFEQHRSWFQKYLDRDNDFLFVIEEQGRPVGQASLYEIDWCEKTAQFGRLMIGEADAAGRGLAREATVAVCRFAFDDLRLDEVYLEVFSNNGRAVPLYERCGFERVGETGELIRMRSLRDRRAA